MDLGIPELLIVLVIVVLVFGPGRIGKTLGEVGGAIKSFRDGMSSRPKEDVDAETPSEIK